MNLWIKRSGLLLGSMLLMGAGFAQQGEKPQTRSAAGLFAPAGATLPAGLSEPIKVFVAKKIVTMDPGWPEATAVAVAGGKILSVGSLNDLKPYLDRFPYEIDRRFADKVIYPGFVEPHSHPYLGGILLSLPPLTYMPLANPYGPEFPGVHNRKEMEAKLKEYVAASKDPGKTVITWGYDVLAMGEEPDKTYLDGISPDKPLVVWDSSEHYIFVNSAVLKKYGLTKEVAGKTLGVGYGKDGELNGQFLGVVAARLISSKLLPEFAAPEVALKSMKYLGDLGQQAGITTTSDLLFGGMDIALEDKLFRAFFDRPDAHSRVVAVADSENFKKTFGARAIEKAKEFEKQSNDRIMHKGVKFFTDDAFLSLGMKVVNPGYIDSDKYKGMFLFDSYRDYLNEMWPWWDAGFQIHVHTNGNAGNETTLKLLADLQNRKPRFDHRFTFQHYGLSTSMQARRIKALGAVVSTNPYYVYTRSDLNAREIGTDRASEASRIGSLVSEGVIVSLHSDTPVAPPRPLEEVWIAVNRIGILSHKVKAPGERIPVDRAMRMITIDAAYTLGEEDKIGSIEAGKLADFTVLGADPRKVPSMKIKDVAVIATILGGKVTMTSETRKP